MIMPCGLSIIKEVLSECPSVRVSKCPRGPSGRRGEWEKGRVGGWEKSSDFLLPSSDGHRTDIRYIRYIPPCESVAELPSSFFPLPTDIGLTSVTSVTSSESESVAELPSSFLIKLKPRSAIAKPKPKLQPNCRQPQSSPLRY